MTRGRIRAGPEPVVPVRLHGRRTRRIDAVLDTGFTGHLCLAQEHGRAMRLVPLGDVSTELADGRAVKQRAFLGEVTFDRRRRPVLVTMTASRDSLVGTALLSDKDVRIDFRRGRVWIR